MPEVLSVQVGARLQEDCSGAFDTPETKKVQTARSPRCDYAAYRGQHFLHAESCYPDSTVLRGSSTFNTVAECLSLTVFEALSPISG